MAVVGVTTLEVLIVLIEHAVPILTAMSALTAAIAACVAAWRGQANARAIVAVQGSADDARTKAAASALKAETTAIKVDETHRVVNGRIDQLIAAIRQEADLSIAAARREAERAVVHAQRNAQQVIESFRAERILEERRKVAGGED